VVPADDAPFDASALTTLEDSRWVCEHRNLAIRAMVRFRRVTEGSSLAHTWSGSSLTVAYARDGKGYVAINLGGEVMEETLQTGLAEGSYCNVLQMSDSESCGAETRIQVNADGTASLSIPAGSAIALHVEGT
jgi:alpha-amylase